MGEVSRIWWWWWWWWWTEPSTRRFSDGKLRMADEYDDAHVARSLMHNNIHRWSRGSWQHSDMPVFRCAVYTAHITELCLQLTARSGPCKQRWALTLGVRELWESDADSFIYFWHAPLWVCSAKLRDIILQSGRFGATSIASFRERFSDSRSCWVVFIHIVRGVSRWSPPVLQEGSC